MHKGYSEVFKNRTSGFQLSFGAFVNCLKAGCSYSLSACSTCG